MTKKTDLMLIAYDGSAESKRALHHAARYLSTDNAIILTAWEPIHKQATLAAGMAGLAQPSWGDSEGEQDPALLDAQTICTEGVELAKELGFHAESYLVESASTVWSAIVDAADQLDVDVIVTGTRGNTGLRALLQSSVADHVLRHSHRPVLIVPPEE